MELSVEPTCQNVTWKIRDFLQLPSKVGYSLSSPKIHFAGDTYCLKLYPNGKYEKTQRIDIFPERLTSTLSKSNISFKVGYKWRNKKGDEFDDYICLRPSDSHIYIPRSLVLKEGDKWLAHGTFTVLCSIRLREQSSRKNPKSTEAETSEQLEGLAGVSKLQSDYRQLLQKGARSDACLVVSGKEFRAHRCVLCSRSDVFEAMFGHETAENESGRVVIDDLDPESFGEFLEYLYTGSVGAGLSDDNAFGLYAAADKYDVPTLKLECVAHMRRNLSVDSFCDVMTLALRHGEDDLLQKAIEFFKGNLPRIILTVKWQQFLAHNSTGANELLIKAFVPGEQ